MFDALLTMTAVARRLGVPLELLGELEPMRPASRGEEALYNLAAARRLLRERGVALRPEYDLELMPLAAVAQQLKVPQYMLRSMPAVDRAPIAGRSLYGVAGVDDEFRLQQVVLIDGEGKGFPHIGSPRWGRQ